MPTIGSAQYPPPASWEELELLVWDLFKSVWRDPNARRHGRKGQPQQGVDIYGRPGCGPHWEGVQVKGKAGSYGAQVSEQELRDEVSKAKEFEPQLKGFTMVTSARRDAGMQRAARNISKEHSANELFAVDVWGWDDVQERFGEFPDVARRHYPQFFSMVPGGPGPGGEWPAAVLRELGRGLESVAQELQKIGEASGGAGQPTMTDALPAPDDPPLPAANYVSRAELESRLRDSLSARPWTALVAPTGMGKTQLARAAWDAQEVGSRYWVTLPTPAERVLHHLEQQMLRWHATLTAERAAGHRYAIGSLRAPELLNEIARRTGPGALLVVDNLPDPSADGGTFWYMGEIGVAWRDSGNKLLTTGYHPLPTAVQGLMGQDLVTLDVPLMTAQDMARVLAHAGAPVTFQQPSMLSLLEAVTRGHPVLVDAVARWLARNNWPTATGALTSLMGGKPVAQVRGEARNQVRRLVPSDGARELLDRLSMVETPFNADMVWVIASVAPPIALAREQFSDLLGPWVQPLGESRYVVSPLLQTVWREYIPQDLQVRLHAAIAHAYFGQTSVTVGEAFQTCLHLFQAKAWEELARVLLICTLPIKTSGHALRMEWAIWFFAPGTAWPQSMPSATKLLIRASQVHILMLLNRPGGAYETEMERLIQEISTEEPLAVATACFLTGGLLEQASAEATARRAMQAARALRLADASILDSLSIAPEIGFWGAATKVAQREEIRALSSVVREMTTSERVAAFAPDPGFDMAVLLAGMAYGIEAEKPAAEQEWLGVLEVLQDLESVGKLEGAEPLYWAAIRVRAQALADFMGRTPEALELLESAQSVAAPAFKFLLRYTEASILLVKGRADEAHAKFMDALAIPVERSYPFCLTDALARGMVAATKTGHWAQAKEWCLRNLKRSDPRKGLGTYEHLELLGELAWIHWSAGARQKACSAMAGVVRALAANAHPEDPRYKETFLKVGHVLGWLAGEARGRPPQTAADGSAYGMPYPGIIYNRQPMIARLDTPTQTPLLLAQLAMLASGIGALQLARNAYARAADAASNQGLKVCARMMELQRAPLEAYLGNFEMAVEAAVAGLIAVPVMQSRRAEAMNVTEDPSESWALVSLEDKTAIERDFVFYYALVPAFMKLVVDGEDNPAGMAGLARIKAALLTVGERLHDRDRWEKLAGYMGAAFDRADGLGTIRRVLQSLDSNANHDRLVLYIALASHSSSRPQERAVAQAMILTHFGPGPFDPAVLQCVADWVVRTWRREAFERGFRLSAPETLRQVLREVESGAYAIAEAARILLATEVAAGANYTVAIRSQLQQLAFGK